MQMRISKIMFNVLVFFKYKVLDNHMRFLIKYFSLDLIRIDNKYNVGNIIKSCQDL